MKRSTPSAVSLSVISSREIPSSSSAASVSRAPATSSSRLARGRPCRRKASNVAGGTVSTVSGPISSSTYMSSRYLGFFVLVLAHSSRWTPAPCAASAFQRPPAMLALKLW